MGRDGSWGTRPSSLGTYDDQVARSVYELPDHGPLTQPYRLPRQSLRVPNARIARD
jgi:hypothetical protein